MTLSIRKCPLPEGSIVLYSDSGALPSNFTHVSALFDKFPKQVPNSCTNPGTCRGADSHVDPSGSFCHGHTGNAVDHSHTIQPASAGTCPSLKSFGGGSQGIGSHNHGNHTSGSNSTTVTVSNNTFSHDHSSINIIPPYITSRYIKKGSIVNLRSKLPQDIILLWNNTIATIPPEYSIQSSYNDKYIRGVPDACTDPGTTGGTTTHQHGANAAAHIHTQSISSHGHTYPSLAQQNGGTTTECVASEVSDDHTHGVGSNVVTAFSGAIADTSTSSSHQHGSSDNDPLHHIIAYIKSTIIPLRKTVIPHQSLVLWDGTLASIPTDYLLANGLSSTPNLLDRYSKGIPNDCTNPGTQAGNANHQHSSVTHTHDSSPTSHVHTTSGTSAAASNITTGDTDVSGSTALVPVGHTHGSGTTLGNSNTHNPGAGGGHQHTAVSNDPASKDFAFIQRRIQ